jgi:XTP/dITP diphosphohydrolase
MQVIVATGNKGKLREFEERLEPLGWTLLPMPQGLPMPEETGSTYEENALIKAASICHATQTSALADDSGLEVNALGGAPGVYSARFGGFQTDLERNLHLLEALRKFPEPRVAKFVSVVTLAFPDGHVESYRGESAGVILEGPRGSGGFGYDSLFFVPELGKTFAELTLEEKRQISHRGRALEAMLAAHRNGTARRELSRVE